MCIPDEAFSTPSPPTATGQARPIRAPRHAHHHATMPLQAGLLGTVGGLPQNDAAIVAATGQLLPVRAPRHPADRGWLPMAHPQAVARAHVPHLHLLLIAAGSQHLSIVTPLQA